MAQNLPDLSVQNGVSTEIKKVERAHRQDELAELEGGIAGLLRYEVGNRTMVRLVQQEKRMGGKYRRRTNED